MFNSIKATIKTHTNELVSLALTVARQGNIISDLSKQNKQLFKENWHLNYKLEKLLEAMQLEWQDNRLISKRNKKSV